MFTLLLSIIEKKVVKEFHLEIKTQVLVFNFLLCLLFCLLLLYLQFFCKIN